MVRLAIRPCLAVVGRRLAAWTPALGGTMIAPPPIVGAVMDIVVWLRSLGLGKYEAAFRENDIDETVLPSLTERAPEAAWRQRRLGTGVKLLDAIAALRSGTSAQGTFQ